MANVIMLLFLLILTHSHAQDQWLCTEESSQRQGSTILACGIGIALDENTARSNAFENARTEFAKVCSLSSDCKGHSVMVTPKRTTCEKVPIKKPSTAYKCYRALAFDISPSLGKPDNNPIGKNFESTAENDIVSRGILRCTETEFNVSVSPNLGSVINPTCQSKSGETTPYKVALSSFKFGVLSGSCSLTKAGVQAALDAEATFKLPPAESGKVQEAMDNCRAESQKDRERHFGSMGECFNVERLSTIFEIGKICGDGAFGALGGPTYVEEYKYLCMKKKKNKKSCSKLADDAYLKYLLGIIAAAAPRTNH